MILRESCRIAGLAILVLAGCAPNFDGKLPCRDDHDCQSGFHCGAAGKCVTGDSPPRITWLAPDGATPLAGSQTFSVMVDHPDGVASAKLLQGTKELATFTAPADFGKSAPAQVDFKVDTTALADGPEELTATATNTHGLSGGDAKKTFNIDNAKPTVSGAVAVTPNPAKKNDQLSISFTSNKKLQSASVTVAGNAATQASNTGNAYVFNYTVAGTEPTSAPAPIVVTMKDLAGVDGVDNSASVTFIFTAPTASALSVSPNPAKKNDQLVIGFTASEKLQSATVTLAGHSAVQASNTGNSFVFSFNVAGTEPAGVPVTITVTMTDLAGNLGTNTSLSVGFIFTAPAAPTFTKTVPASPAHSVMPAVVGTAAANTTVKLYVTSNCSGTPNTVGSAATFAGAGIVATVADNATTTFYATATDAAGNVSPCSSGANGSISFTADSIAPAPPLMVDTNPHALGIPTAITVLGSVPATNNPSDPTTATVTIYGDPACTTAPMGTGSAAIFSSTGIPVTVPLNSSTTFHATATDLAGNVSTCSTSQVTYIADEIAPAVPTVSSTNPASPSNSSTTPLVLGSAALETGEAPPTITLFSDPGCINAVGSGSATAFNGTGIQVTVPANATTTLYADSTDAAGNISTCSTASISYTHRNIAPAVPTFGTPLPAAAAMTLGPKIVGSVANTNGATDSTTATVKLYSDGACTALLASGTAANFASAGLGITVPVGANNIYATATDLAGNVSACTSTPVVFTSTVPTVTPATSPTSPSQSTTPKISGTVDSGAQVSLYTDSACSSAVAASGGDVQFSSGGGIQATVAANSTTTFYARATLPGASIGAPPYAASGCSTTLASYTNDQIAPAAPVVASSTPAAPARSQVPTVNGTAGETSESATVNLYASNLSTDACAGPIIVSGPAASGVFSLALPALTTTTWAAGKSTTPGQFVTPTVPNGFIFLAKTGGSTGSMEPTWPTTVGGTVIDNLQVTWVAQWAIPSDGKTFFTATATDAALNVSPCSTTSLLYVTDNTPPSTPAMPMVGANPSNNLSPTLTGTISDTNVLGSESNFTVKLYQSSTSDFACSVAGNVLTTAGTLVGTFSTGTGAAWSGQPSPALTPNNTAQFGIHYYFKVVATDASGNISQCSPQLDYVLDTDAPAAPKFIDSVPTATHDEKSQTPTLNGTAEQNATVKIYLGSACTGTQLGAPVANTGCASNICNWSFNVPSGVLPANGTATFVASATDVATNTSTCSTSFPYTTDNLPPPDPTITTTAQTVPAQSPTPTFAGASENGSTVSVYSSSSASFNCLTSGTLLGTATAGVSGTWSFPVPSGANQMAPNAITYISVKATDTAGNVSVHCSNIYQYTNDINPPLAPTISVTSQNPSQNTTANVGGTVSDSNALGAETGYTIKVYEGLLSTDLNNCPGTLTPVATFNNQGSSWSGAISGLTTDSTLQYGKLYYFKATATDPSGNTSPCSTQVIYDLDTQPPAAPTITSNPSPAGVTQFPIINATTEATGPAPQGNAVITVYWVNNNTPGTSSLLSCTGSSVTGTADATGHVSIGSPQVAPNPYMHYRATSTDSAGNPSQCSTEIVYQQNSSFPQAPVIVSSLGPPPDGGPAQSQTPTLNFTDTNSTSNNGTVFLYAGADAGFDCTTAGLWDAGPFTLTSGSGSTGVIPAGAVPPDGTTYFKGIAIDTTNVNKSGCSTSAFAYVSDNTAPTPSAPVVGASCTQNCNPSNNTTPPLSGSATDSNDLGAESGFTIKLYESTNVSATCPSAWTPVGTFLTGAGTTWSGSPSPALSPGADIHYFFKVTATDPTGNTSACSPALDYVLDTVAPPIPVITSGAAGTTPASPATSTTPTINGNDGTEANATIKIFSGSCPGGTLVGTGTTDGTGAFQVSTTLPDPGAGNTATVTLFAQATDNAGNTQSTCSNSISYVIDKTPPAAPTVSAASPATGSLTRSPNITGSTSDNISTQSNITVRVYSGSCAGTLLATGSAQTFGNPGLQVTLNAGSTTLYATATDEAGNVSACSSTNGPSGSLTYNSAVPTVNSITSPTSPNKSNTPTISGTIPSQSVNTVINLYTNPTCTTSSGSPFTVTAGNTAWSIAATALTAAATTSVNYYATAFPSGYAQPSNCSITTALYQEDNSAPSVPTFNTPSPAATAMTLGPKISGSTTDDFSGSSNVTVKLYHLAACADASPIASDTAANFSTGIPITIPGASVGSAFNVYATATDQAGNVSACTSTPTAFTSTRPVMNSTTNPATGTSQSTTPTISGTGTYTASTTMTLYKNDSTCATGAGGSGALAAGTPGTFSIQTTPALGNDTTTNFFASATITGYAASACASPAVQYKNDNSEATPVITSYTSIGSSTVTLQGTSSEVPVSTSTIYVFANDATCNNKTPGTQAGSTTLTSSPWTVSVPLVPNAITTYYAYSQDSAGNKSNCSAGFLFAPHCASGIVSAQIFNSNMEGCGCSGSGCTEGTRANRCAPNTHPCTADEYVEQRNGVVPTHVYWTEDVLNYSFGTGPCGTSSCGPSNCFVTRGTTFATSSCGAVASPGVCPSAGSDAEGNLCSWVNCGYNSASSNQYLGLCLYNNTAGTLCCSNSGLHLYYVDTGNVNANDSNNGSSGSPWKTIGRAFNTGLTPNAVSGDTVFVKPGTYTESFTIAAGVNLIGDEGSSGTSPLTKIAGLVTMATNAVLAGFTVTNPGSFGYGVNATNVSSHVRNNTVTGNYVGIQSAASTNTVRLNSITANSYGLYSPSGSAQVENNNISLNTGYNVYTGVAIDLGGGSNSSLGNNTLSCGTSADVYAYSSGLAITAINDKWDHASPTSSPTSAPAGIDIYYNSGTLNTANSTQAANPCPACAAGSSATQLYDNVMAGCGGHLGKPASSLCPSYCHVCSSSEYNSHFGGISANRNYWTADTLYYYYPTTSSGTGNCSASPTQVTSSGVNGPFLCGPGFVVTVSSGTDADGNTAAWTNCGYGTNGLGASNGGTNEYLGGCTNGFGGALCCCP